MCTGSRMKMSTSNNCILFIKAQLIHWNLIRKTYFLHFLWKKIIVYKISNWIKAQKVLIKIIIKQESILKFISYSQDSSNIFFILFFFFSSYSASTCSNVRLPASLHQIAKITQRLIMITVKVIDFNVPRY